VSAENLEERLRPGQKQRKVRAVTTSQRIKVSELLAMAERSFGSMVKAVVDVRQDMMLVDAELHADQEAELLAAGSKQTDLWGINLYPELHGTDDFLEFDSMINLRPSYGNRSRGVENPELRQHIATLVQRLVEA
jgi:hypothetical protein